MPKPELPPLKKPEIPELPKPKVPKIPRPEIPKMLEPTFPFTFSTIQTSYSLSKLYATHSISKYTTDVYRFPSKYIYQVYEMSNEFGRTYRILSTRSRKYF
ncbi:hypothetical protein H5410_004497 [Solanum commersonii]|uniref:Uncharacterized protein n=1 Tax=Solanum commersonii TaxID=4109 RepID=A0A9J6B8A0_SOLCO|nr:hypothetical protein H5410_004497 [Solanum commersonii]